MILERFPECLDALGRGVVLSTMESWKSILNRCTLCYQAPVSYGNDERAERGLEAMGETLEIERRAFLLTGLVGVGAAFPNWLNATSGGLAQAHAGVNESESFGIRPLNTPGCEPSYGPRDPVFFPFATDSPWNTPIGSGAQLASDSDETTLDLLKVGTTVNRLRWSVGVGIASDDDPITHITYLDGASDQPRPPDVQPEPLRIPPDAQLTGGQDGWFVAIQPDRRTAWDFYALKRVPNGYTTTYWRKIDLCGSGIDGGTRASKMALLGGLIREADIEKGEINHAIAISASHTQLRKGFVWPAYSEDGGGVNDYSGSIPMGSLFAIPGGVDVENLRLTRTGLLLARALQNFGAYVAEGGSTVALALERLVSEEVESELAEDWAILKNRMRRVTNNSPNAVGGGGMPRVPLLQAPICPC